MKYLLLLFCIIFCLNGEAQKPPAGWHVDYLHAETFWRKTGSKGSGAVIFLVDSEPNLKRHVRFDGTWLPEYARNFTRYPDWRWDGHAYQVGDAALSIAPEAKLVPIKISHRGLASSVARNKAIEYITNLPDTGAIKGKLRIINISNGAGLGGQMSGETNAIYDRAIEKGCVIIASAGNRGRLGIETISSPANYPPVIAVGAINGDGTAGRWNHSGKRYSGRGKNLDFTAPGTWVYLTKKRNRYGYASGTSISTPMVSGVVALLATAHPWIDTQDEVRAILKKYATPLPNQVGHSIDFGWGVPQLENFLKIERSDIPGGEPPTPPTPNPPAPPNPGPTPDPVPNPPIPDNPSEDIPIDELGWAGLIQRLANDNPSGRFAVQKTPDGLKIKYIK